MFNVNITLRSYMPKHLSQWPMQRMTASCRLVGINNMLLLVAKVPKVRKIGNGSTL